MDSPETRMVIRNFVIEVLVYSALVIVYFLLVLRWLAEPLSQLFRSNLAIYALVSLVLIVAQGVLLEFVTSVFLDRLGLDRLE